jgi:hypothetical protein
VRLQVAMKPLEIHDRVPREHRLTLLVGLAPSSVAYFLGSPKPVMDRSGPFGQPRALEFRPRRSLCHGADDPDGDQMRRPNAF